MTDTIQSLLQRRISDTAVAVKYGNLQRTWAQYLAESAGCAAALLAVAGILALCAVRSEHHATR